jgi:hypothetical protein
MVGTEETIEFVENATKDMVVNIQLLPVGYIRGCLLNPVDLRHPYRVIVDPRWRHIRVWMTSTNEKRNRAVSKAVERIRRTLTVGRVGIDPRDAVSFRYADGTDMTSRRLALVLNKMIASVEQLEVAVTFYTMLDSHIPRNRVRKIMKSKFPKWKSKQNKLCRGTS